MVFAVCLLGSAGALGGLRSFLLKDLLIWIACFNGLAFGRLFTGCLRESDDLDLLLFLRS